MTVPAKKRLGELLVDAGIIDETQLKAALGHQRQWGVRLGQAVVDLKLASEQEVVRVLAKRFGFEVARLDQVEAYAHQQAVSLVPREFAVKYNVFPLAADTSTLSVAMSDPSNLAVIDELRFRSGRRVKVSIGGDQEIAAAIQAAYPSPDGGVEAIALDIDEGEADGESVMGSFGGGSSEDFDSFFGAEPAQPHVLGTDEDDPFSAGPAAAPVPAVQAGPLPAALHAPFPAPVAAQPAPIAQPAAPAPVAQPPASVAQPRPAAGPAPTPPQPAPAAQAPRAPATSPAVRAAPAAPPVAPRAAAPAARPAAPAGPATAPQQPRAQPQPQPQPRPMIGDLELELPTREHALRAPPAAQQPAPAPAAPAAQARAAPAPAGRPAPAPAAPVVAAPARAPAPGAGADLDANLEEDLATITGELVLPAAEEGGLSPAEQAVLDAIERLAAGGRAEPETLKPTQAIAVLIRLLMKKGIVSERELLDALAPRQD